jgi:hypothetical protein
VTGHVERPSELIDLQGAWRRNGRIIGEGSWHEVSEVLWLQVGRHFCDLRTPHPGTASTHMLDQTQAFSGTVAVGGGNISFHHDIDSLPRDPSHPDQGTVHRLEDTMMERGPGFEERWIMASLPGDETAMAEYRASDAVLARVIRVGSIVLAIWGGSLPGGAQYLLRHEWIRERPTANDDGGWQIDAAALALGQDTTLPDEWLLAEPEEV